MSDRSLSPDHGLDILMCNSCLATGKFVRISFALVKVSGQGRHVRRCNGNYDITPKIPKADLLSVLCSLVFACGEIICRIIGVKRSWTIHKAYLPLMICGF